MKKNINLRKLVSFALVGLLSCGNLLAAEQGKKIKKSWSWSHFAIIVGLTSVGAGIGFHYSKKDNGKIDFVYDIVNDIVNDILIRRLFQSF